LSPLIGRAQLYTPPPFIPQGDDERTHDDVVLPHPPIEQLPAPGPAPGGAPGGGPRQSGCDRKEPSKEGNIYPPGMSTNRDLHKKLPQTGTLGSALNFMNESSDTRDDDPAITKMAAEGGALWYAYLLGKAIPHHDGFLDPMNVHDWTIRDIGKLPADQQQEWCKAQLEELEAPKNRNVYELVDLPAGQKAIKNQWVFDIKSDGRKKAHLVIRLLSDRRPRL